jgi:hypothetical protein
MSGIFLSRSFLVHTRKNGQYDERFSTIKL